VRGADQVAVVVLGSTTIQKTAGGGDGAVVRLATEATTYALRVTASEGMTVRYPSGQLVAVPAGVQTDLTVALSPGDNWIEMLGSGLHALALVVRVVWAFNPSSPRLPEVVTPAVFTIQRTDGGSSVEATVVTVDGTAKAGTDYTGVSTTISVPAAGATVSVAIINRSGTQGNRSFKVRATVTGRVL
jgi:hypothetical protein